MSEKELKFRAGSRLLDGLLLMPDGPAVGLYIMAHGAGAGMRHEFMDDMARRLLGRDVATLRYQFPYMQEGRKRPDPPGRLTASVKAAIELGLAQGLPTFAGGKSMGGRMTSTLCSKGCPGALTGLIFLGFPLHAPGRPGNDRARHLYSVDMPMLFVQGTRDKLADLKLLEPVIHELGDRAVMHVIEGGDHSFGVLKRSGRTVGEVRDEMADAIANWMKSTIEREHRRG